MAPFTSIPRQFTATFVRAIQGNPGGGESRVTGRRQESNPPSCTIAGWEAGSPDHSATRPPTMIRTPPPENWQKKTQIMDPGSSQNLEHFLKILLWKRTELSRTWKWDIKEISYNRNTMMCLCNFGRDLDSKNRIHTRRIMKVGHKNFHQVTLGSTA